MSKKKVTRAVLTAAGLGTRFLPWSKSTPKELLPLVDRPVIEFALREVAESGITDVLIITSRGKEAIADYFDRDWQLERTLQERGKAEFVETLRNDYGLKIHYVRQAEPKGLGHAVLMAQSFVGEEPFALLLPDELYEAQAPATAQLLETYERTASPVIGLMNVADHEVERYGIVDAQWTGELDCVVSDMVEKPEFEVAPSNTAICGRYVLTPDVFDHLRATKPGAGGEIQLTDGLRALLGKRPIRGRLIEGERLDVGTIPSYLEVLVRMALRHPEYGSALRQVVSQELEAVMEVQR